MVHWATSLAWISASEGSFASVVPGLENVELLRPAGVGFDASTIAPLQIDSCAGKKRFPLSCSAGDLDQDDDRDLMVFDPSCFGSWTAYQTGPGEMASAPAMEGLPPTPELQILPDLTGDGAPELLAAALDWIQILSYSAQSARWKPAAEVTVPTIGYFDWFPSAFVSSDGDRSSRMLVQGSSRLWAFDLVPENGSLAPLQEAELRFISSEYLKPFVGFDAAQTLDLAGCQSAFAGIGRLPGQTGGVPSVQIVEVSATEYAPTTVSLPMVPHSLASVRRPAMGDAILVALGDGDDGETQLAIVNVRPCRDAVVLGSSTVELNFRTPRAPEDFTEDRLDLRAIPLIARLDPTDEQIEVLTYDGFAIHRFRTGPAMAWAVTYESITIHDERSDLAW